MGTGAGKTGFLKTIVENKKRQVAAAEQATPLTLLREAAERRAGSRTEHRSFAAALSLDPAGGAGENRVNIIAEIKRASPSKGTIREHVDPAAMARTYARGGAAAISVLTETDYFKGSINDLEAARAAQGLPVLRKDFIVSEYQVYESAAIGADAILLIVRILREDELAHLAGLAHALGMDVLVEVHDEAELDPASRSGARLIGINNRNLDSFETDISIAERMVSKLTANQVPVAASGIASPKDIEAGVRAGIRNFLVGESIMRAEDPEAFLRSLCK